MPRYSIKVKGIVTVLAAKDLKKTEKGGKPLIKDYFFFLIELSENRGFFLATHLIKAAISCCSFNFSIV